MIRLEYGPEGRPAQFDAPSAVIRADTLAGVAPALLAAEAALARGQWLAGLIGYEAGYLFEPRLRALIPPAPAQGPATAAVDAKTGAKAAAGAKTGAEPLVLLGVYDAPPRPAPALAKPLPAQAGIGPARPLIARAAYDQAMARLLAYIRAGDCYQVNLTFPLEAPCWGSAGAIYARAMAHQPVGYGALIDLPGALPVLSLSPELFFARQADGTITVRPMKGTRPRDSDPARDAALAADLAASEKDRAENLMIVDLMRNDLARLSQPGSVTVPGLFQLEHYATVHQMVSTITARLKPGVGFGALIAALFPCGSVTGAPKIRAMQIIAELEAARRGAYCGAIGWAAPDGAAAFNVAIRSLVLDPQAGLARFHVGGGVVADSTADGEWEEALWKTRFAYLP